MGEGSKYYSPTKAAECSGAWHFKTQKGKGGA